MVTALDSVHGVTGSNPGVSNNILGFCTANPKMFVCVIVTIMPLALENKISRITVHIKSNGLRPQLDPRVFVRIIRL